MDKNDIDLSNLMYKSVDNLRSSNVVKKQMKNKLLSLWLIKLKK